MHPPTDFYRALLHDLPGKVFEQRSSGELYVGRPPRSYHMLLKEELMFAKHMLFSILTAGVVMLAVSSIPPAMGLAPRGDAPSDGRNRDGSLAVTSHLGGENPGLAAYFAGV